MVLHTETAPTKKPNNVPYSRIWVLLLELVDENVKVSIAEGRVLPLDTMVFHKEPQSISVNS